jgi:hypothetical protein
MKTPRSVEPGLGACNRNTESPRAWPGEVDGTGAFLVSRHYWGMRRDWTTLPVAVAVGHG